MGRGKIERERVAFVASVRPSSFSRRDARACQREKGERRKGRRNFFGGERKCEERRDGPIAIGFPRSEEPLAVKLGGEKTRRSFDSWCFFRAASPLFSLMPLSNR